MSPEQRQPFQYGMTNQERIQRKKDLIAFAMDEEELYNSGETENVSSMVELATCFNYTSAQGVSRVLREAGVPTETRRQSNEKEVTIPLPSRELAWFIGAMAGSGEQNKELNRIALSRSNEQDFPLLEAFKTTGESLFNIHATLRERKPRMVKDKVYQGKTVTFSSAQAGRFLGDFRSGKWSSNIAENHAWILKKPEHIWGLLEGYFETNGGIYFHNDRGYFRLHSSPVEDSMFLIDLLTLVDVQSPKITKNRNTKTGIGGISIQKIDDVRHFAQNIHSRVDDTEEKLERVRNRESKRGKVAIPDSELIAEWKHITQILGHSPSCPDIVKLKRAGLTKYSDVTYLRRFGKGSFNDASGYLNCLLKDGEDQVKVGESGIETQIFP